MTIGNIIIKNIKGNLNKYVMYYLSNVIVVTIFFLFADFAFNPAFDGVSEEGSIGTFIGNIMKLCEFVIVIFTIIFSGYSISNFLKSREKEFGLLSMFGLTKSQIRRYVIIENIIISTVSIITGIFFGILFSKLFYMAVESMVDLGGEVSFVISAKALLTTVISFIVVLNLISFVMSFKIKNNNIAELLKGSRIPKKSPKFSKFKSVLALVLIVGSYIVAIKSKLYIVFTMIPIFIAVVIGTKLLFTQFSVYFTEKLKNSKHVFYKGVNMITLSQIIYKLKDNAKVMFITSILSGVTLATAVSVYSIQQISLNGIEMNMPNDIAVYEKGLNSHEVIDQNKITDVLKDYDLPIKNKYQMNILKLANKSERQTEKASREMNINEDQFYVISSKDYNELADKINKKKLNLNSGESVLYVYDTSFNFLNISGIEKAGDIKNLDLENNGNIISFKVVAWEKGAVLNDISNSVNTLIVNENDFNKLYNNSLNESKYTYYGYNVENNSKSIEAITKIETYVDKQKQVGFSERITKITSIKAFLSIILFIGTFIAMIFFIATGSILYFKMFNEIQKDRYDFIGLKKIGVTRSELNKTISIQSFIMFFLPLVIATLHAVFAVKSVGVFNLQYFVLIVGIYIILQLIFYLFAKWMYAKQINSWN